MFASDGSPYRLLAELAYRVWTEVKPLMPRRCNMEHGQLRAYANVYVEKIDSNAFTVVSLNQMIKEMFKQEARMHIY